MEKLFSNKSVVVVFMATIAILIGAMFFTGCGNRDEFDTVYTFDKAVISWPDGTTKEIEVATWRDYEDGEQIQIKDKATGHTYLVHSENCILISTED